METYSFAGQETVQNAYNCSKAYADRFLVIKRAATGTLSREGFNQ
jgi:hypothetical protein